MFFPAKEITLKDGRAALFRSPSPDDGAAMLEYLKTTSSQTPFLLRSPDEYDLTIEAEQRFLQNMLDSETNIMIVCTVDGKIAGNCQISRKSRQKNRHRGTIGIALVQEFWGLGIGTAMFEELISVAKTWGLSQVELEVFEGNHRAIALYEKMGFETVAAIPNTIRLEDGTMLKEFTMVKVL